MKKKILFIIHSVYGGGLEKRLHSILENLDKTKFEPHLCVFHLTGNETLKNIPIYNLSTKFRPASFFLIWKLIKVIKKTRPDKIFSALWNTNLISIISAKLTNTPIIINEGTTPSIDVKSQSLSLLKKRLIQFLYPKATVITTVSDYSKRDLVKNFGLTENKIHTICNGIDIRNIENLSKAYSLENKNYVLSCGGLNWWKNYDLLIEAAEQLPDTPIIILGKGKLKDQITKKAKALKLNLVMPGYVNNPYPYFKNAAIFVLTSIFEGFPNVLLEAMALKIPVISVDCPGGIREIIKDGETGLIIEQNNKQALANAIQTLATNSDMRNKLAQNAYNNINKKFTLKKMMKKYEEVLDL